MKTIKIFLVLSLLLVTLTFMAACDEVAGDKETEKNEPVKEKIEETTAPESESETEEIVVPELEEPSEELLQRIEDDRDDYYREINEEELPNKILSYYGEYDGCVPVIFRKPIPGTILDRRVEVAGSVIKYTDPLDIIVWKDGDFYSLEEAYELELLTKEQIAVIAEIHNLNQYLYLNRY